MLLEPVFWPRKVNELREEHRTFWCAYWAQDLPTLRTSYPELAHWDDRGLIGALTNFYDAILGRRDINTTRDVRFLEWLHLSSQRGFPVCKETFYELKKNIEVA